MFSEFVSIVAYLYPWQIKTLFIPYITDEQESELFTRKKQKFHLIY